MAHALRDLSFENWIAHVFDHDVRDPQWYFDLDSPYWDGPADLTVEYLTRLFTDPLPPLSRFTDAQLNQGFWYLVPISGGEILGAVLNHTVPLASRIACVQAIEPLFRQLFASRCTPHLSHLDEAGAGLLNMACYMWWDIAELSPEPIYERTPEAAFDEAVLATMEAQLQIENIACQESGLHGLGHWNTAYPGKIRSIIDRFLQQHSDLRPELVRYAEAARSGCVL